MEKHVRT